MTGLTTQIEAPLNLRMSYHMNVLPTELAEVENSIAAAIPQEGLDKIVEYLAMHPDERRVPAILSLVSAIKQSAKLRPAEQCDLAAAIGVILVRLALRRLEMAH